MGTHILSDDRVARKAKGMWRVVFCGPKACGAADPARHGGFDRRKPNGLYSVVGGFRPAIDKKSKDRVGHGRVDDASRKKPNTLPFGERGHWKPGGRRCQ